MQQEGGGGGGGGGGGEQSHQFREMSEASEQLVVETASPISSRPPAVGGGDEFTRLTSVGGGDELGFGGGGGSGGGGPNGNRWPRQETLALLKIRSEMDATFRDATVKGPLWEDVSRKLAELGYKRSAKKCREKFENVHKYYKRTKENRGERQHGKSYKFFSELEAFYSTSAATLTNVTPLTAVTSATLDVGPVLVGFPMPISSAMLPMSGSTPALVSFPPPQPAVAPVSAPVPVPITTTEAPFGISFSSNSSTFSQGFDDDSDDEEDEAGPGRIQEPSSMAGTSRKRKRSSSKGGTTRKMMEFMEGLMKQVMQKQESMQRRFLEAMEKREQDRNIREEAWKRQESARLTREHELLAQERAVAASRDAAIVSLLQKITGQTIQLPKTVIIPPAAPPPPPPSQPTVSVVQPAPPITTAPPLQPPPPPPPQQQQQQQQQQSHVSHHQHQHQHQHQHHHQQQQPISSEIVMATPERQVRPSDISSSGSLMTESASSRWPKTEVLALINLRSGLESRYQEAGPKGPLWEEISAGMLRLGYRRNPKRCKEKWENINKYFKKVKESNKQRPEDAKTCPYFHQLDALYRKKILGGGTSSGIFSETSQSQPNPPPATAAPQQSEHETGGTPNVVTNKEGNDRATKKSEYTVRELMEEQQQQHQGQSLMVVDGYDHKMAELDSMDDDDGDDDELEDDDDDEEEEMEVQRKMGYKIEFQRQNSSTTNGGGHNGTPSTFTMVQ